MSGGCDRAVGGNMVCCFSEVEVVRVPVQNHVVFLARGWANTSSIVRVSEVTVIETLAVVGARKLVDSI